jgi:hypothetical protein
MINGVRVRDSGVELSPTGTDRRGGPRTASNRTVRASSAIAAGSTRWLMRGPNGHFRPDWRNGQCCSSEAGLLGYDERVALICRERYQLAPEQHQRGHYRWSKKKAEKLEAFDASEDAKQNP